MIAVVHAEGRALAQLGAGNAPQAVLFQQHQHGAFGGAAGNGAGIVEGRVIIRIDEVFLVQHQVAAADSQQLRYRVHANVGPGAQQGALSLHADDRAGGINLVFPLEGQHQRVHIHIGRSALDALELAQHLVQLHGVDGLAFHVHRLQDAPAVFRGIHRRAHALGGQQLLIHQRAPGSGFLLHFTGYHILMVGGIGQHIRAGVNRQEYRDDQYIGKKQPDEYLAVKVGVFFDLH